MTRDRSRWLVPALLWVTTAGTLWHDGIDRSALICVAMSSLVTGMAFADWCHGRDAQ